MSALPLLLLAAVLLLLVVVYQVLLRRKYADVLRLPCPPQHWLWGMNIWDMDKVMERDRQHMLQFGTAYFEWAFWFFPFVAIVDGTTAAAVLRTAMPKSYVYHSILGDWLGYGLLISYGQKHRSMRRILTPAFHFNILRGYMDIYTATSEVLLARLAAVASPVQSVDVQPLITNLTLDIITQCAFGYNAHAQETHSEYVRAVLELSVMAMNRLSNPLLHSDFTYFLTPTGRQWRRNIKIVHELPERAIAQRIAARQQRIAADLPDDQSSHRDFLDILVSATDQNGKPLDPRDIRDEVDTFMFEGHDTTASAIMYTLYCIAQHPAVEQRLLEEIDEVLPGEQRAPSYADLQRLRYLRMVIKEALRLYPPVPYIFRVTDQPVQIDGRWLPKGAEINILIHAIHRNPRHWDRPDDFVPDRFCNDTEDGDGGGFDFVPFSAGPRNCIGRSFALNEERTVLAMLLKHFRFRLDASHPVLTVPTVIARPKFGMRFFVEPRQP